MQAFVCEARGLLQGALKIQTGKGKHKQTKLTSGECAESSSNMHRQLQMILSFIVVIFVMVSSLKRQSVFRTYSKTAGSGVLGKASATRSCYERHMMGNEF